MERCGRREFVRRSAAMVAAWSSALLADEHQKNRVRADDEDAMLFRRRPSQESGELDGPFKALREGDRVELTEPAEQIMEKAYRLGYDLEKRHGGCARCTVAALQQVLEFVPADAGLFRAASCLDGGATPHGLQNCGAFTGAGMFIGWVCGTEQFKRPVLARKLIREVYTHFEQEYGTVLCKDVREKLDGDCPKVVALAAQWTAEALLAQFADHKNDENRSQPLPEAGTGGPDADRHHFGHARPPSQC